MCVYALSASSSNGFLAEGNKRMVTNAATLREPVYCKKKTSGR